VVNEAFLLDFPKSKSLRLITESLSYALDGAEIFHVYNSAFTPEFANLLGDKGRALK
jgi:hypothetical protein